MKTLLVDNSLDNTGASKALIKPIAEIPPGEFEFTFLFPENSKCVEAAQAEGFKAFSLNFTEISKRTGDLVKYFPGLLYNGWKIKRFMKKNRIDVVHVNDIYNMLGMTAKLMSGVKLVTHIRRMPESFPASIYRIWSRLHVKFADHIIAVSKANKNALPANNKTTVIYDPLPEDEVLAPYQPKKELQKTVRILYLANYTGGKGHLHALMVLNKAVREFTAWNFQLDFYGGNFGMDKNDVHKQSLIQFANENGLNASVQFNGKTNQIEEVMKAHDIVWNFSDSESFSRVTLEALFYGVPVIATDVGGTNEMVIDGKTGLLAASKNVDDMYRAFKRMILDDEERISMAANGYRYVREEFSKEKTVNRIVDIYRSLNKA